MLEICPFPGSLARSSRESAVAEWMYVHHLLTKSCAPELSGIGHSEVLHPPRPKLSLTASSPMLFLSDHHVLSLHGLCCFRPWLLCATIQRLQVGSCCWWWRLACRHSDGPRSCCYSGLFVHHFQNHFRFHCLRPRKWHSQTNVKSVQFAVSSSGSRSWPSIAKEAGLR